VQFAVGNVETMPCAMNLSSQLNCKSGLCLCCPIELLKAW